MIMTTFEIAITVIAVLGVLLIGFMIYRFEILMSNAIAFFIRTGKQLSSVRADMYDDVGNHYLVEVLNKLDNNNKDFKKLTDIVDKMHRNLCVQIADKMVDRVYPPTYNPPCYAPNGICTNPQRDCINCPKIGTGGTWSTSTNISKNDE